MKKIVILLCVALVAGMLACAALAETKDVTTIEYSPVDENTHDKIEETWTYNVGEDGELASGMPGGINAVNEAHVFEDGKCTLCGYELTEEDPETEGQTNGNGKVSDNPPSAAASSISTGEVSDEPAVREIAADEVVHGVSAAQGLGAVQTLTTVVDSLGENDVVKLADAEKLFTADELEKLNQLSAKEQVLVLLAALGYDLGEDQVLSAEAQALLDAIRARTTPEELLKVLPVETLTIDGQEVECYVVTLACESADGEVVEHYAFRKDDGSFAQLTIEG